MVVEVQLMKKPDLVQPRVVCGLPGSGFVGKLAVDHLVKELKADLFGSAYSYAFPPQIYIRPSGVTDLMKHELYCCKSLDSSTDFVFYTGDAQPVTPEAEYEMSNRIMEIVLNLGAKMVYTLAAYITGQFVETPRVYGTATDEELLKDLDKYGAKLMHDGSITGMNGLLIGLAKVKGMKGTCLLGETSGYVIDAKASQAVLEVLTKMLGVTIDMKHLEERAKQDEAIIRQVEEMRRRPYERSRAPSRDLGYIS